MYGAKLWWKGQKNHENAFQQLLNRQARLITGMYLSTPVYPLLCEAGLTPTSIILDNRQRLYAYRLPSFPDEHLTEKILPISLRVGDRTFQPEELPEKQPNLDSKCLTRLVWTMASLADDN